MAGNLERPAGTSGLPRRRDSHGAGSRTEHGTQQSHGRLPGALRLSLENTTGSNRIWNLELPAITRLAFFVGAPLEARTERQTVTRCEKQ